MKQFLTILILVSLLFSIFGAQLIAPVEATITWTVDDDGSADFSTIEGAIDAASDGDTIIVNEGTYAEGQISVYKSVSLKANGTVIVDGLEVGHVFFVTANNVTIEGFTVRNSKTGWGYSGIRLQNVKNCVVSRNTVTNNTNGIGVGWPGYSEIRENNATNNYIGIGLYSASLSIIEENTLRNNYHGIRLYHSCNNIVRKNVATENGILPGQLGLGIYLEGSSSNSIEGNTLRQNRWTGILVYPGSDGNIIRRNNISRSFNGIYLMYSDDNLIYENAINLTSWSGLKLRPGCVNNTFVGNTVRNMSATGPGIFIQSSNSNVFTDNLIVDVPQWVYSLDSSNNVLYHNSFINAYTPYGISKIRIVNSANVWDSGYPSGGNYWDDHEGPDDYAGPDQNEAGSDGIVDVPYIIDEDNRDRYALTEPWEPPAMTRFLIRTIGSWELSKGTEKCLIQKLEDAFHLLNQGNENGAIHKLTDFIIQVETLRGKKLTEEQANYLISEAQKIIDLIQG